MGRYISLPIVVDIDELTDEAFEILRQYVPGWEPADGNLDVWMLQTTSRIAADLRQFASDVPDTIFRYFGEEIVLVQPKFASEAWFSATWTAIDNKGYVIPAGVTVAVRKTDGTLAGFQTVADYTIPAGSTSVTGVVASATEEGAASNGLSTTEVELIDAIPWIASIVGDGPTSGGSDGETNEEYMDRLVDEIRLMGPTPVTADDYATVARRVDGIGRAYVLNLYNYGTFTANQEKCVTIVVTDENGELCSASAKTEALDLINSVKEVNVNVWVVDPQYKVVNATFDVHNITASDPTEVHDDVVAELQSYLSPKNWGNVEEGTEFSMRYQPQNIVRYNEVIAEISNVYGVDYTKDVTIMTTRADYILVVAANTIPVVLPRPGTITGTVT